MSKPITIFKKFLKSEVATTYSTELDVESLFSSSERDTSKAISSMVV